MVLPVFMAPLTNHILADAAMRSVFVVCVEWLDF
jgi:hypothetical protein